MKKSCYLVSFLNLKKHWQNMEKNTTITATIHSAIKLLHQVLDGTIVYSIEMTA